jgi:hypothetical protein
VLSSVKKKALQGQELHNVAGSALLGLAKIKKQLPSRFRSSLGWGLLDSQDAQSSFVYGRMLRAPSLQDALCSYHSNAGCFKLLFCRMPRGSSCVQVDRS